METRLQNRLCDQDFTGADVGHCPPEALPFWKRALDFACLLFAAPALLPLMAIIALGIRLSSRGPVLFRQERIGLHGRPFTCFKFRTMKCAADTRSHELYFQKLMNSDVPMKKLDSSGDGRILGIGVLLRASGLDELPQVFNVLRGEMSLVGPRPCIRYEYEKFKPEHRARFNAVPGLTGLWQVNGKNRTTFQEMIDFDIQYSRQLSFMNDLGILLRTFPVLVQQVAESSQRKSVPKVNGRHVSRATGAATGTMTPV
jgi:lipopolysaccharide/colanic/teichoic acid biosynthesis glycosyltransferase